VEGDAMKCPACSFTQETEFTTCPSCNVIVAKYLEKADQRIERDRAIEERRKEEEKKQQLIEQEKKRQEYNKQLKLDNKLKEAVRKEKTCPYCRMEIHKEAKICPHCRKRQYISNKTVAIVLGGIFILIIAMCNTKPYNPPPISQNWNDSINIDINRVLVANHITDCGMIRWQQAGNHEYIVKCSMDDKKWTTYQVWTAINAVNVYGK
jgi:hypothetical protein